MHKDHGHEHERPVGDSNYEPTDAHVAPMLIVGAFLVIVTAAAFLVGYFLLKYSTERPAASAFVKSPLDEERRSWDSLGGIRLQPDPVIAMNEFRAEHQPALHEYGVISDLPEIYHFPIEEAIEYVAEHGLPQFRPFGDGSLEPAAAAEPAETLDSVDEAPAEASPEPAPLH